jgi:MFS transporter, DHA2 family, methylenomycin A resistance protein
VTQASSRALRLTLIASCVGQGMILLDVTIVNVALPSIQRELGVTPANLEWVINAYSLALASLLLVGGTIGDRYGRKRIYLAGFAVFTLFSMACALATDDHQLILFRALQGVGAAMMAPLSLAILLDAFPAERRAFAIGVWAAVAGIGFGAGPIVGGLLIEAFDWSAIFWVNVPLGLVGIALTLVGVRESRDPEARRLDPVGAILAASGLFLLTFALVETNEHPWGSAYILSLFAGAVVALTLFLLWESRVKHPMVPLTLFRSRTFSSGNLVYGLSYTTLAGMFFFLTLYFQSARGWSALETGLSWLPMNSAFILVTPFAGKIGARFGPGRVAGLGCLVSAGAMIGFAQLGLDTSYLVVLPFYVMVGLGYGLAVPAVSAAAMAVVAPGRSGAGSGILNSSRQIGTAVGLAVLGSVGVAAASAAWDDRVPALPAGVQAEAATLLQRVAGGEGQAVGERLGSEAVKPAVESFLAGLHAAFWVCAAGVLVASVVAFVGLRAKRGSARTATSPAADSPERASDSHA